MALPELLQPTDRAEVGVFGGSGFYSLMEGPVETVTVQTPYGPPSDDVVLGRMGDVRVAFMPRHGRGRVAIRHHGVTVVEGLAELTAYGLEASAWAQGHVRSPVRRGSRTSIRRRT